MEELARLQASRKGYKSHVTRLYNKVDEILSSELNEFSVTSLTTAIEQLNKKKETLSQIDRRVTELIESPEDLEEAIFDAEETQDTIVDKIAKIRTFIELQTRRQSSSTTVSANEAHLNVNSQRSESSSPPPQNGTLSPSNMDAVSTTMDSQVTNSITSPTNHDVVTGSSVSLGAFRPISSFPTFTTATTNYASFTGPPPLIPAVSSVLTLNNPYIHEPLPVFSTAPFMATSDRECHRAASQFAISRLPKLTLPIFSGDPLTWQTFWDSFNAAIHANPSLSGVQKFNYLKAQLQGDAARTIAGLPLTEVNYQHSIALLEERFGQPHKLVTAHMQALLEMPSPTSNLASLQAFYDSIETHTRGLSSLGKSRETYGDLLVPIILGKLPMEIRKSLAREHTNTEWTINELTSAILKEIRILESGFYTTNSQTIPPHRSTAAFHVVSKEMTNSTNSHNDTYGKRNLSCIYCKGPHSSHACEVVTDYQKWLDIVKRGKLCYNCLAHHKISQCTSRFRCRKCKKKHHTSLCSSEPPKPNERENSNQKGLDNSISVVHTTLTPASRSIPPHINTACLLKTAIAPISAGDVKAQANILFDEGAQRSFISAEMAAELHITPATSEDISIASFGTNCTLYQQLGVATVKVETNSGELIPISVLIVPSIAAPIQNSVCASVNSMSHLRGLKLAHPVTTDKNFKISLLIGTDYYWTFVQDHIVRGEGPTAQQSKLGYLLSGPMPYSISQTTSSILLQITSTVTTSKEPDLEQFWSVEAIGTNIHEEQTDTAFLQTYQNKCISQTPEGTYIAKFPWKEDRAYLPSNFGTCKRRTLTLINKLRQTPELLQIYDNIIREQEQRGFIERVDEDTTDDVHYLPHHPVRKDSPTTPIRIVYDCSCRASSNCASLNDCLMVGPPFLNDLCAILLRFRDHIFAFCTDIEKAFLHVKLHESDRNFTRFLWPSSTETPESNLQVYRFKVVPFGSSSSPFMLGAVLDLHLNKFQSHVADDMKKNIYVDNVLSGGNTEEEIVKYYRQAREIMSQAGFNLRSWSSNSHCLHKVACKDQTRDPNPTVTVLGLRWNTATDTLSLAPKQFSPANTAFITKRDVLQSSSQLYDPLGWATPVTIRAKILLQEIWQSKISWDEPLSVAIRDKWLAILTDLLELPTLSIPRAYFSSLSMSTDVCNMYVFSDASTKAYGAVVYICKNNQTSLVMSKSRVAPIKSITLPKLELMAAVMATRLAQFVISSMKSLKCYNPPCNVHLWTDSQIVLYWICKNSNHKPFITRRVQEIIKSFPADVWSFTPSSDNPADLLTRGISTQQLISSRLWSQGPHWLTSKSEWPQWLPINVLHLQSVESENTDLDEKLLCETDDNSSTGIHNVIDISRYSHINRLLVVTSYVLRFVHNTREQQNRLAGPLTVTELNKANKLWILSSQNSSYQLETAYLLKEHLKCPALVRQL